MKIEYIGEGVFESFIPTMNGILKIETPREIEVSESTGEWLLQNYSGKFKKKVDVFDIKKIDKEVEQYNDKQIRANKYKRK